VPAASELAEAHLSTSLALDVRPLVQLQYLLKEMEALSELTLMALPEAQVPTATLQPSVVHSPASSLSAAK
jgi:hypothetical protein